ncbi:MAG: hypothetical protein MJE68_03640 [Proteobacteria bacterium]|nr:hypothetical protein [Pseudomonadota bacterium]
MPTFRHDDAGMAWPTGASSPQREGYVLVPWTGFRNRSEFSRVLFGSGLNLWLSPAHTPGGGLVAA